MNSRKSSVLHQMHHRAWTGKKALWQTGPAAALLDIFEVKMKKRIINGARSTAPVGESNVSQVNPRAASRPRFGNTDIPETFFARVGDLRMHPAAHVLAKARRKYLNILIEDMRYFGYSGYHPVTVTKAPDNTYFVVKGGVRYEAALEAGVEYIPCVLRKFSNETELKAYMEDEGVAFNSFRDC